MSDDHKTQIRLEEVVDRIQQMYTARFDEHKMDDGTVVVSLEADDQGVSASGPTRNKALSSLIENAKEVGWA